MTLKPLRLAIRAAALSAAFVVTAFTGSALATDYVVTNPTDTGPGTCPTNDSCSLQQAISQASNDGDTVTLRPNTYKLDNGEMTVSANISISGASATNTIIDAQGKSRIFDTTGKTVTIRNLAMINGRAQQK